MPCKTVAASVFILCLSHNFVRAEEINDSALSEEVESKILSQLPPTHVDIVNWTNVTVKIALGRQGMFAAEQDEKLLRLLQVLGC